MPTRAGLLLAHLFLLVVVALLSRCLYDIHDRLSLTFEIKRAAAISEIGIMGNVVVGAAVASWDFFAGFYFHEAVGSN
ncbi:MAG: hypothetical protein A2Z94_00475 [Gallionellales bacterium GWA2_55_18]|nr:MAG: hypothetical protein A2Z94_00475 [Gallionellales bacterium GWA2_55_18]